jgi:hypothetical protein
MVCIKSSSVTCSVFLIIFLSSLLLNAMPVSAHIHERETTNSTASDSYLISDVPYISQQTNFFCGFATKTMILNYYQLNTTLEEVLYNSGIGYTLNYYQRLDNRLPYAGWLICQGALTNNFLAEIYGLSYDPWVLDTNLFKEKQWNQYWQYIKQHIVNNTPIIVLADQIILGAYEYNMNIALRFLPLLPPHLTNGHSILVVGFNEHNNSVCYHDPQYGLYNISEKGTYRWIDKDVFKLATKKGSPGLWVKYFYNTSEHQVSKKDAFLLSHHRNIEKLKGNFSLYYKEYPELEYNEDKTYGIHALQTFQYDIQKARDSHDWTLKLLKLKNGLGLRYRLLNVCSFLFDIDFFLLYRDDVFDHIAIEKQYAAQYLNKIQYLFTDENISVLCEYESDLLYKEAKHWSNLSTYYSFFRKKGVLLCLSQPEIILNKMINTITDIIDIQQQIIAGPTKNN